MDHWKTMLDIYAIASLLFSTSHSQSSSNQLSGKPQVILYFKMWHFSWFLPCRVAAIVSILGENILNLGQQILTCLVVFKQLHKWGAECFLKIFFFSKSILCNWQLTSESSLVFNFLPTTLPFKKFGVNYNGKDI